MISHCAKFESDACSMRDLRRHILDNDISKLLLRLQGFCIFIRIYPDSVRGADEENGLVMGWDYRLSSRPQNVVRQAGGR